MLQFPDDTTIFVPCTLKDSGGMKVPGGSRVLLYNIGSDGQLKSGDHLKSIVDYYRDRIKGIFLELEELEHINPDLFDRKIPIFINMHAQDMYSLNKVIDKIKHKKVSIRIKPDENAVKIINFLTGFHFVPYFIPDNENMDSTILQNIWEYYLHNQFLKIPIQPLHALLINKCRKKGPSLWNLQHEQVGKSFYIDEKGSISLSSEFLTQGYIFGSLNDSYTDLLHSGAYERLSAFNQTLFQNQIECMYCAHMPVCRGYFKRFSLDSQCVHWKKLFDSMDLEIKHVQEMVNAYETIDTE